MIRTQAATQTAGQGAIGDLLGAVLGAGPAARLLDSVVVAPALAGGDHPARAFGCHHTTPALVDGEALLAGWAEAAWIATEGSATGIVAVTHAN